MDSSSKVIATTLGREGGRERGAEFDSGKEGGGERERERGGEVEGSPSFGMHQ